MFTTRGVGDVVGGRGVIVEIGVCVIGTILFILEKAGWDTEC